MTPLIRRFLLRRKRARLTQNLPALSLSALSILEGSVSGTTIAAVLNAASGAQITLTNSAGGRFVLSGSNLQAGSIPTNYEDAQNHLISITQTKPGFTDRTDNFIINVVNEFEAPTLNVLTLSASIFTDTNPVAILGATAGSTLSISNIPAGLTLNSNARTIAWDGSTTVATQNITVTETLTDSPNSPRQSVVSVSTTAAANVGSPGGTANLPIPLLERDLGIITVQEWATTLPIKTKLTTKASHEVGDVIRFKACKWDGTGVELDASVTLVANTATNKAAVDAIMAQITTLGTGRYIWCWTKRGTLEGPCGDPIWHGSFGQLKAGAVLPAGPIIAAISTQTLALTISHPSPFRPAIRGEDLEFFIGKNTYFNTSNEIDWIAGTPPFGSLQDFDKNDIYDLAVELNFADGDKITHNLGVQSFDDVVNQFSLGANSTNLELNEVITGQFTIAGLNPAARVTAVADNALLSISGGTPVAQLNNLKNDDVVSFSTTASSTYSTPKTFSVAIGSISASRTLVTKIDPNNAQATVISTIAATGLTTQTTSSFTNITSAAEPVLVMIDCFNKAFAPTTVALDGQAMTKVAEAETLSFWYIANSVAGNKTISVTQPFPPSGGRLTLAVLNTTAAGAVDEILGLPAQYNRPSLTTTQLDFAAQGIGLIFAYDYANPLPNNGWTGATPILNFSHPAGVNYAIGIVTAPSVINIPRVSTSDLSALLAVGKGKN